MRLLLIGLLLTGPVLGQTKKSEADYSEADCRGVDRLLASLNYLGMRGVDIQLRFLGPGVDDCFEEE